MIYFDNASTTQQIGSPSSFFNPSSPHSLGIKADRALRDARIRISSIFNCLNLQSSNYSISNTTPTFSHDDFIFTSGGTESNNLAILGFALSNIRKCPSLVFSPYEHPSIIAPINFACERKWAQGANINAIPQGTALITISQVNHETGDINNIRNLVSWIKENNPSAIIHVDGAQGFCKEKLCFDSVDMYSFSGHKVHGPVGVGGLWVRKGIPLTPQLHGGGQEKGLRSGTENVAGIIQMTEAIEFLANAIEVNHAHVTAIKQIMLGLAKLTDVTINTLGDNSSPYILNMSFLGVKGEVLVHALSEKGLFVSMGAACRSRKSSKSALELMGFSSEAAKSAIRFSFSHLNTLEEAATACELVSTEVKRFRKMKGFKSK